MNAEEKVNTYEMFIIDMLNDLNERYSEFDNQKNLSDFEAGRKFAYYEIRDVIQIRHEMILELLEDEE